MRKKLFFIPFLAVICFPGLAQLSGVYSVPGTYSTIGAAINALNTLGVSGAVTINVSAGHSETVPSPSGYTLNPVTGASSSNQVTFRKNGSGSNPLLVAGTGTATPASAVQDGVWLFAGTDYVTIDGIDILDPNGSNPSTMEFGFGFFKVNGADGCQNNTIRNCRVTLSFVNNAFGIGPAIDGSRGILLINALPGSQTSAVTVTASTGCNSDNKFQSNTIQNCNIGFSLFGFSTTQVSLLDANNEVGGTLPGTGNTVVNYGGGSGLVASAAGIRTFGQYNLKIARNTINNNNGLGANHATTLRGIYVNTAFGANTTITDNTVTVKGGGTTAQLYAIDNNAGSPVSSNMINISNNLITNCTYSAATSGQFIGIFNQGTASTITIVQNTLANNSTAATSNSHFFILNSGTPGTKVNVDNNSVSGFTFTSAGNAALTGISNSSGTTPGTVSVSNNSLQAIHNQSGTSGSYAFILVNSNGPQVLMDNNRFINLSLNGSGNVILMQMSGQVSSTSSLSVSNNSIITGFSKATGGSVTGYLGSVTSSSGLSTALNNNFSNITLSGATTLTGWSAVDGTRKLISGNIFQNWIAGGTSPITAINVNVSAANTSVSANQILGLSCNGAVTGISFGSTNSGSLATISNNLMLGLTGSTSVTGILVQTTPVTSLVISQNTVGSLQNNSSSSVNGIQYSGTQSASFSANRIYNLENLNINGLVNGISLLGGSATLLNNLVGDLRTPNSQISNAVIGLNAGAGNTHNFYYNTVYLTASSTSTGFGTSAVSVANTATIHLKNNLLINNSVAGTGGTITALKRSTSAGSNYSLTSNNNIFYAGVPSASNLLYDDGTFQFQTVAAMQSTLSPRESVSATELTNFLSLSGSNAGFLHVDPTFYTFAESGAVNISGITTDADLQIRAGNAGYTGNGSNPDIGADEFTGSAVPCNTVSAGASAASTTLSCAGQAVTIDRTGGSGGPDFSFQWKVAPTSSGTYTNVSGGAGSASANYTTGALPAGNYYFILVTTCSVTSNTASTSPLAITVNSNPAISAPGGTICSGKSFTIVPSGATSYTYSGGSAIVSPPTTTTYSITGHNGPCMTASPGLVTVTVSPSPTVSLSGAMICPGQSHSLSPTGASTYSYLNSGPTVTPSANTAYSVTGSSSVGCAAVNTAVATISIQPTFSIGAPNGTICPTASFVITPTGAATYTFSSGSATVSPASNTSYSVTGRSPAGCPASNTAVVNVFVAPNPTVTVTNGTVCTGKSYTIQPSGASTYSFSPGGPVVTPSSNTNYSVSGTSSLGCKSTNTAVLTVSIMPLPTVSISNGSLCTGRSYTLNPSGALTYTFSGGSAVVSPTNITSYSVTGSDGNGCVSQNTAVATLTAYVTPTITINGPYFGCSGVQLTFTATGANTYTWSNGSMGTGVLTPSATVVYSVTGEDIIGCRASAHRTIFVTASPTITVSNDTSVCKGKKINLMASGATTYTWNTGHLTPTVAIVPAVTQMFSVIGASAGCSGSAAISVTIEPAPVILASSDKQVICSGEQVVFTASGAQTHSWSGGVISGTAFTPTLSSYTVTGAGSNGCESSTTLSITVNSLPAIVATSNKNPLCIGENAVLFVDGPHTFTWSTGPNTRSITVSPPAETTYTVYGKSIEGCSNSTTLTVKVTDCTDLSEHTGEGWLLFPNPATDRVSAVCGALNGVTELYVYSVDGRLLLNHPVRMLSTEIDISGLPNGIYQVFVVTDGKIRLKEKLVKQ
jgi:hypothetical protein